jgi:hypothetical protein
MLVLLHVEWGVQQYLGFRGIAIEGESICTLKEK